MGILGLFSSDDEDKNLLLTSLGFFSFQHCYLTHVFIGAIADLLVQEDVDPEFVLNGMKEAGYISETAKQQCQRLISCRGISREDKSFFTEFANVYDLLNMQANAVVDFIETDGDETALETYTQARKKGWEVISEFLEWAKKMREGA